MSLSPRVEKLKVKKVKRFVPELPRVVSVSRIPLHLYILHIHIFVSLYHGYITVVPVRFLSLGEVVHFSQEYS